MISEMFDALAVVSVLPTLKMKTELGLPCPFKREGPGQLSRRIEAIDACCKRFASQVLTCQVLRDRLACQHIVGGRVIHLSLLCDCIARMYRAADHDPGGKPGDRASRPDAEISIDDGRGNCVGDRRAGQDPEARRRPQGGRLRMAGRGRGDQHQAEGRKSSGRTP